jgi:hypothetical protein
MSKAWTVFTRSNAGVMGSNPNRGMDVCVRFFCCVVLYVDTGHATGWSPPKESYRLCIGLRNWKVTKAQQKGCRAINNIVDEMLWMK